MDRKELNSSLLTKAINNLAEGMQETLVKLLKSQNVPIHLTINNLLEIWFSFTRQALQNPEQLAHAQMIYWKDYLLLCQDLQRRLAQNHAISNPKRSPEDNRAQYDECRNKILFNFIDKFHFLMSQHVQLAIKNLFTEEDLEEAKKRDYYNRYFAEAFSINYFMIAERDVFA